MTTCTSFRFSKFESLYWGKGKVRNFYKFQALYIGRKVYLAPHFTPCFTVLIPRATYFFIFSTYSLTKSYQQGGASRGVQ